MPDRCSIRPTLVLTLLAGLLTGCHAPGSIDNQPLPAVEMARDSVFPALVNIQVITAEYWSGKETKGGSVGSGTIISPEGLVLTNHHVVDNGRSFRVTLADKQEATATLVGEDPLTDLAVLRIDLSQVRPGTTLQVATLGDSSRLAIGDRVLAMGSPFALSRSVTMGIVSNTERVFSSASGDDLDNQEFDFETASDIFTRWIQHDALINPGNSGGPLVNLAGEVVGVNTRGGSAMGFAVPSELASHVARQLIEHGSVTRSTFGIAIKSIKRSGYTAGVLINSVDKEGPAAKAGLAAGDVLLSIGGAPVNAQFPEEIPLVARAIADLPVGAAVNVTYRTPADASERSATLTTERLMRDKGKETSLRLWGLAAREITDRLARAARLEHANGAYVLAARPGGPAQLAEPPLQGGDVIRKINATPIGTLEDLVKAYQQIAAMDPLPDWVMVEFDRAGKSQLTLIKPRIDKPDDPPREVPKPWIGVATQPVLRDLAREMGLGSQTGFRVTRVYPGTLAARDGLKVGDIIVALNTDALSPRGMQDAGLFQRKVRQLSLGQAATLKVVRDGSPQDLAIELERTRIGPEEAIRDTNRDFDLTVRELTFFDLDDNRWETGTSGVLVVMAEQAGWASMAGLYPGDLIQTINGTPVTDLASYRAAMERLADTQPERVTFVVLRGGRTQFKFAEPDWKPATNGAAPQ